MSARNQTTFHLAHSAGACCFHNWGAVGDIVGEEELVVAAGRVVVVVDIDLAAAVDIHLVVVGIDRPVVDIDLVHAPSACPAYRHLAGQTGSRHQPLRRVEVDCKP